MVPITVAAGAAALVGSILAALFLADTAVNSGNGSYAMLPLVFLSGIGVFVAAMRWDRSDRERTTLGGHGIRSRLPCPHHLCQALRAERLNHQRREAVRLARAMCDTGCLQSVEISG